MWNTNTWTILNLYNNSSNLTTNLTTKDKLKSDVKNVNANSVVLELKSP